MRHILIPTMLMLLIAGCAKSINWAPKDVFNWKAFTGIKSINTSCYEDAVLDYRLDTKDKKEIYFANCFQIENIDENTIVEPQYYHFKLLSRNCEALKLNFQKGKNQRKVIFEIDSRSKILANGRQLLVLFSTMKSRSDGRERYYLSMKQIFLSLSSIIIPLKP